MAITAAGEKSRREGFKGQNARERARQNISFHEIPVKSLYLE